MRTVAIAILLALLTLPAAAQPRVVAEVKKSLDTYSITVDKLKAAMNKLTPALSDAATKDRAETWHLAGKLQYRMYDKYQANRNIGQKVDVKAMGHSLIDGYDYFSKSLSLDTVFEKEKSGKPKFDPKTHQPKVKTKYSGDIVKRLGEKVSEYNKVGGELYNIKDWDGAFKAWDIYCRLAADPRMTKGVAVHDTTIGQARYYQAITAWQKGDNRQAAGLFATARSLGYTKKEAFDYALVCLSALGDEPEIVRTAEEAYRAFGTTDVQYVRILINDDINRKDFDHANELLDKAIAANGDDAELHNLKGLVVEQQQGLDEALPHFLRCVELAPDNAQAQFNVGRFYYNQAAALTDQKPSLSRKELRKRVTPLYRQAMPYFEKSLELEPDNEEVRNALRNIYYRLGEGKKLEALDKR